MQRRLFSGLLITALLADPRLIFAAGEVKIAVVELRHPGVESVLTHRIAGRVRDELKRGGTYQVLSPGETEVGLASLSKRHPDGLASVLEGGRDLYRRLEFQTAISILETKLEKLREGGMTGDDSLHLVPALLFLGTLYQVNGEETAALRSFEEAVRLASETVLSERDYSPEVRDLFRKAREKVKREDFGRLQISSSPSKAEVLLNGTPQGRTPVEVKEIPPGRHYLVLRKEGYGDKLETVEVPPRGSARLSLTLPKESSSGGTALILSGLERGQILLRGREAGRHLGVDRLVLIHAEEKEGSREVTAELVNVTRPEGFTQKTVRVEETDRWIGIGARQLTDFLTDAIGVPEPSQEVVIQEKSHLSPAKPFWKRPAIWIVGGIILAGTGAGLGVALTRGGGGGPTTTVTVNAPVPGLGVR